LKTLKTSTNLGQVVSFQSYLKRGIQITMENFNIKDYITSLNVSKKDEEYVHAENHVEMTQVICEDAWLCRQGHFGFAGAMEQQLKYLGETLLPNAERRLVQASSVGVSSEDYNYDEFGFVSQTDEHKDNVHSETADENYDNQQSFVDGLRARMKTAAILFLAHLKAHDELSHNLNQLTYGQIKAKAEQNRMSRELSAKQATG